MYPYLSDYLRIRRKDGSTVEVLNGCRTGRNVMDRSKVHSAYTVNHTGLWDGCCPPHGDRPNDPDPWGVEGDPSSFRAAGFQIDNPDGNGHGFYIQPASSTDVISSDGFVPLEAYITGTIVSNTSDGERRVLQYIDSQLTNLSCGGSTFEVFIPQTCRESDDSLTHDVDGRLVFGAAVPVEPERPDCLTSDAETLDTSDCVFVNADNGFRSISGVRYLGFEELDEGFHACAGNRYKFNFEIDLHTWNGPGVAARRIGPDWGDCECLCTNRHAISDCTVEVDCPETVRPQVRSGVSGSLTRSRNTLISGSVGGLIAIPGRYVRPEKVQVRSSLSPKLIDGEWGVSAQLIAGDMDHKNIRLSVYSAVDGIAPPDTEDGWCYYREQEACWRVDIPALLAGQRLNINSDGSCCIICVDGTVIDAEGIVDSKGGVCGGGVHWVTAEVSCNTPSDLIVDAFFHKHERI